MPFSEFIRSSPNYAAVPVHERLGVCFHHSVSTFEAVIARMLDPASQVSYHAIVASDGTRCQLVPDEKIAWHAGASSFLGRSRCNDFLLGLAFAGDTYAEPITRLQLESALEWLASRWVRYGWSIERMTDHRQISPGRKDDLNPIEWERLRAAI
ncbi:MAG TPA: N-acetylmuramoyl-L-alanine amidase, partial [Opitutaceae bacterium]|nr:N-acetylmuramoyl-L-alanine amidase [Opitutaceae bacterium]